MIKDKINLISNYIKRILPFIKEKKHLFFIGILMMIIVSITKLLDPLILAHIVDYSVPKSNINDMYLYSFLFLLLVIVSGISTYFQNILFSKWGLYIITKIKYSVFEHLLKLPISYFDKNQVGELIARVESDSEKVKQFFSTFSIMIIGNIIFFIGMFFILLWKNWKITLLIMLPIPIIIFFAYFMMRYLNNYYKKIRVIYAELSALLTEYIQGINIIQLFNRQEDVRKKIENKSNEKRLIETKANLFEYGFWSGYNFLVETLFILLVIWLLTPKILIKEVSLGTLIIFIQYGIRLFQPLIAIAENINFLQKGFVSLQRIFSILDLQTEYEIRNQKNITPFFEKEIEFKNVYFQYKENEPVLQNINFTIKKGEKIALVGASGSGKTTVVSLLCGFYNTTKGEILIDGVNINDINLQEWRKKIGLVLQDIYLFPGNILENIRIYNDEISEDDVQRALNLVQAEEFLNKRENGILLELKERGQNISMGEKQLLSFARAIVFNPEIIIMDEATASIDAKTEAKIHDAMEEILKNKTAVIVAHRLNSIINADNILLFQNGRIIAQGKHNDLINQSPEYKKLVELQFIGNKTEEYLYKMEEI